MKLNLGKKFTGGKIPFDFRLRADPPFRRSLSHVSEKISKNNKNCD